MLGVGDVVGGLQTAAAIGTAVILRKVLSRGRGILSGEGDVAGTEDGVRRVGLDWNWMGLGLGGLRLGLGGLLQLSLV